VLSPVLPCSFKKLKADIMLLIFKDIKKVLSFFSVIARPPIVVEGMLDRAIQRKGLDYPVKPYNDNH
jgi:hypothetical protein